MTLDLGLRHEFYTPFVGIERQGGLSNYDPATNQLLVSGYGDVPDNLGVESTWRNVNLRTGLSYRIDDHQVVRAGYGSSTIPFGDNTYAYNFPVKQNNQFNAANAFIPPPGISMVGRLPGSGRGADPVQRPASTPAPTRGSATAPTSTSRPI